MEITLTDQATQEVRKYSFFNLPGNQYSELLLSGLKANHTYSKKFLWVDMNGNAGINTSSSTITVASEKDEIPPQAVQRIVGDRTATTATLQIVSNELLRKLKVQYRIVGTGAWLEQVILTTHTTYNPLLEGLQSGAAYEYRYVLEDLGGNQLITDWKSLTIQSFGASLAGAAAKINSAVSSDGIFTNGQEFQIEPSRLIIESIKPDQLIRLNINGEEAPKKEKGTNLVHRTVTVPGKNRDSGYAPTFGASEVSSDGLLAETFTEDKKPQNQSSGLIIKTESGKKEQKAHNAKMHYLAKGRHDSGKFSGYDFAEEFSFFEKSLTATLLSDDVIGEYYGRWLDGK